MCAVCLQVYVLRDYFLSVLSLEWREWMTNEFTTDYFKNRSFYQVQAGALVDNPDQRITNDVRYSNMCCKLVHLSINLSLPFATLAT